MIFKKVIPIVHCFDNNYVIQAGVAFYSLLESSNDNYFYKIFVLHSEITKENQNKLENNIKKFKNSEVIFKNVGNSFEKEWNSLKNKGHYSREVIFKLMIPNLFQEYKKIIVADVDVVYLGDVSKDFIEFEKDQENYLAGVSAVGKMLYYESNYKKDFSEEEIGKLKIGGGYLFMNLEKLREDKKEEEMIEYLFENTNKLIQLEQDVLNLCCYPKIKILPLRNMVCSYIYDLYINKTDFKNDEIYSEEELLDAYNNPIQLHYATQIKPWNSFVCTKSEVWFRYLSKTIFFKSFFKKLDEKLNNKKIKKLLEINFLISKNRKIIFKVEKYKK